jgi:hypothetical protein
MLFSKEGIFNLVPGGRINQIIIISMVISMKQLSVISRLPVLNFYQHCNL